MIFQGKFPLYQQVYHMKCFDSYNLVFNRFIIIFEMLEHSKADLNYNNSLSHLENTFIQAQSSCHQQHSLRKRVHTLMSDNFELKQMISSLQNQLKMSNEVNNDLRMQLRAALEEIESNDKIIEAQKCQQNDLKQQMKMLESQLSTLQQQVEQNQEALSSLLEHNRNLETEIQLLAQLKHKYQLQSSKNKAERQKYEHQFALIHSENEELNKTVKSIVDQYQEQERELTCRRKQIQQYESYVLSKLSEAKNDPEFHEKCRAEKDKYYCKYLKYKEKASGLKRERDELVRELAMLSQEVGSASMRKYVE